MPTQPDSSLIAQEQHSFHHCPRNTRHLRSPGSKNKDAPIKQSGDDPPRKRCTGDAHAENSTSRHRITRTHRHGGEADNPPQVPVEQRRRATGPPRENETHCCEIAGTETHQTLSSMLSPSPRADNTKELTQAFLWTFMPSSSRRRTLRRLADTAYVRSRSRQYTPVEPVMVTSGSSWPSSHSISPSNLNSFRSGLEDE